jgi:hypothetical protein
MAQPRPDRVEIHTGAKDDQGRLQEVQRWILYVWVYKTDTAEEGEERVLTDKLYIYRLIL